MTKHWFPLLWGGQPFPELAWTILLIPPEKIDWVFVIHWKHTTPDIIVYSLFLLDLLAGGRQFIPIGKSGT